MKKLFTTTLTVIAIAIMANAQTCVLSQNFTTYGGTNSALPAGWSGAGLPATGNNYTSVGSSGPSGANSFKFTSTGMGAPIPATLYSPMFTVANGDSVSFWLKANALDTVSKLEIFVGADTITMSSIKMIKKNDIATLGKFFTLPLMATHHYIKFVYTKSVGNLSFDDFCVKTYPVACALVTNFQITYDTTGLVHFTNTSTGTSANTTYNWNFGNGNTSTLENPNYYYSANGSYTVTLTVVDMAGTCSDTIRQQINITNAAAAQTCFLSENFTSYTGSATALPTDWIGIGFGTSPTGNGYSSSASAGPSGANSFKFGVNNATLITPIFNALAGDSVTFWVKGNSTDTISKLVVFAGADTASMTIIKTLNKNNIATNGQFISHALNGTEHLLKFVYTKSQGNMAFDDFCIKSDTIIAQPVAIKDLVLSTKVNVYPNPNNGVFALALNNTANARITIYNLLGEIVYTTTQTNATQTLELNNVSSGTYIVKVNTSNIVYTQKLFINK